MKNFAGLWTGLVGLAAVGALIACSPENNERHGLARSHATALTEKFLALQAKAETPQNLPAGESVQIDVAGRLLYRNNINKNCFISALGTLVNVQRAAADHIVTYKYYKVANSGEAAECQPNDAQCFTEIAECRKVALVIADNLLVPFKATIPLDFKERSELMKLTPYRFK